MLRAYNFWFGSVQNTLFSSEAQFLSVFISGNVAMPETTRKKKIALLTDKSFLLFSAIALIAGVICYARGKAVFLRSVDTSLSMLLELAPRVVAAFFMAGFVQVLVPKNLITKWIGAKSGFKGITIATLAGICTPGGPMIAFPLIAALYKLGADYGALVAYVASWEMLGITRLLVWEIPFMGVKFALLRFTVSLILPFLAGMCTRKLASLFASSLYSKDQT